MRKLILIVVLAACGQAANQSYGPPFATIHGQVAGSELAITGPVRVALVWLSWGRPGRGVAEIGQDIGLAEIKFPFSFDLQISTVPPNDAVNHFGPNAGLPADVDPQMRLATGAIV